MIIIKKQERKPEARYRVPEVAKATGFTEGQVMGFFSNRKISVANGITLEQIDQMINGGKRTQVKWDKVIEIRQRLKEECGIEVVEVDEEQ